MLSEKYGRTYHYPFSPGTTSDDRINHTYWEDIREINTLVHTEKLDGENNCLSRYGVFARSHAAPTTSPWTSQLRQRWELLKNDLNSSARICMLFIPSSTSGWKPIFMCSQSAVSTNGCRGKR